MGKAGAMLALMLATAVSASATDASAAPDSAHAAPENPLALYNGSWSLIGAAGAAMRLDNACGGGRLFYSCEQTVNGKTVALIVFLAQPSSGAAHEYRTQALTADAATPGPWRQLTIDGSHWVYHSDRPDAAGHRQERVLNDFDGPDHIRFTIQHSDDGKLWITDSQGEERRIGG